MHCARATTDDDGKGLEGPHRYHVESRPITADLCSCKLLCCCCCLVDCRATTDDDGKGLDEPLLDTTVAVGTHLISFETLTAAAAADAAAGAAGPEGAPAGSVLPTEVGSCGTVDQFP
jgi:hypothetical protein